MNPYDEEMMKDIIDVYTNWYQNEDFGIFIQQI